MALTFEQLIGEGGTLAPRGAEASDPTPTQQKSTPTRPLFGSNPLARLQAPTVGERLGELLTKTTRMKYEQRWTEVEQEIALAYDTDQARLEVLQSEREELRKHLQGMDKELQELAVARAKGGLDDSASAAATLLRARSQQEKDLDDSNRGWAELRETKRSEIEKEYELPQGAAVALQLVRDAANPAVNFRDTLRTTLGAGPGVIGASPSAIMKDLPPAQRQQAATKLYEIAVANGISPATAEAAISAELGVSQATIRPEAFQEDKELRIAQAQAGLRGGMRRVGEGPEDQAKTQAEQERNRKADEVNAWAASASGRAVLAALSDDGAISEEEAAGLAEIRNDEIEEQSFNAATGRPDIRGQYTPERARTEAQADARRFAVYASSPGIGEQVSTDVRRGLDPRRLETLAQLSVLGDEEATLRSEMVAPTLRNIGAQVQGERVAARAARREPRVAAQVDQQWAPVVGSNAQPQAIRFAQALARASAEKPYEPGETLPDPAEAMFTLYKRGELRDPVEAVKKAAELSPDDPDAVLVPYLRAVRARIKSTDPIKPNETYLPEAGE